MAADPQFVFVKNLLKAELSKRNIGYRELSFRLSAIGSYHDERNVANKICRGSFSAAFFFDCMMAIGCDTISLEHLPKLTDAELEEFVHECGYEVKNGKMIESKI